MVQAQFNKEDTVSQFRIVRTYYGGYAIEMLRVKFFGLWRYWDRVTEGKPSLESAQFEVERLMSDIEKGVIIA